MIADEPPSAGAVASAFRLAGTVGDLEPVAGAWSNRVYRLTVGSEAYAVKELRNPWGTAEWRAWLDEAWSFELRAIAAGVSAPEPVPNPDDGGCVAAVERTGGGPCDVRVHRWVDATPAPLGPATPALARWAGETLAALHGLDVRPANREVFPSLDVANADRWPALAAAAAEAHVPWASDAQAVAPVVAEVRRLALEAGPGLDVEVLTHGDIDQKNVLLRAGAPVLCDWDVAAPLVPSREVADVALSFGTWERFDVAREVVAAYRAAGGRLDHLGPHDLAQPMLIGIDWIVLNIERALRLRLVTDEEQRLGASLVPGLLARLPRALEVAHRLDELFVA